jgi:hypothetical protein
MGLAVDVARVCAEAGAAKTSAPSTRTQSILPAAARAKRPLIVIGFLKPP